MQVATVERPAPFAARLKFIIAGVTVALATSYFIATALQQTAVYYLTVRELTVQGSSTQPVRVAGKVTPGSIVRQDAGLSVRFTMYDPEHPDIRPVPVSYAGKGGVPDIFGDDVDVVVEGRYNQDGTFTATNLLAKCPSRFETAVGQPGS